MKDDEKQTKGTKRVNNNNGTKKKNSTSTKKAGTTKNNSTKKNTSTNKKEVKKATSPVSTLNETKKESVKETTTEILSSKKDTPKTTKKVNKSDLLLVVGLVIAVILGSILMGGKKEEITYELPLTLSGEAGMHQLTYQEYQEKIDNNESFVVILERATCSHCVTFMPVATEFAENNGVPMYYVDTDTFSEEDWNKFEKSNTYLKKANGKWGTPTTVVLAGKQAVDTIEGETTADSLKDLYDKYFEMKK